MSTSFEELAAQASQLPAEDRKHLADLPFVSVADAERAAIEVSWNEELERRVDAVRTGVAKMVSAGTVHAEARQLYHR